MSRTIKAKRYNTLAACIRRSIWNDIAYPIAVDRRRAGQKCGLSGYRPVHATGQPLASVSSVPYVTPVGKLDLQAFRESIAKPQPPAGLSPALQALWWDTKGDWNKAHEHAQKRDDAAGMRVHAYLHRKEGDQSNSEYWYRRCAEVPSNLTLDEEWQELARALLEQSGGVLHAGSGAT